MATARPSGKQMLYKLIEFFVGQTRGEITLIQLTKFLYLADLYSVKWTGKQLTDLDWYYYHHGPWHDDITDALRQMEGFVVCVEEKGKTKLIRCGPTLEPPEKLGLPKSLLLMLENIRRRWAGADSQLINELLKYVYATAPMQAVKGHERTERVPLNLLLERERVRTELE